MLRQCLQIVLSDGVKSACLLFVWSLSLVTEAHRRWLSHRVPESGFCLQYCQMAPKTYAHGHSLSTL